MVMAIVLDNICVDWLIGGGDGGRESKSPGITVIADDDRRVCFIE